MFDFEQEPRGATQASHLSLVNVLAEDSVAEHEISNRCILTRFSRLGALHEMR